MIDLKVNWATHAEVKFASENFHYSLNNIMVGSIKLPIGFMKGRPERRSSQRESQVLLGYHFILC